MGVTLFNYAWGSNEGAFFHENNAPRGKHMSHDLSRPSSCEKLKLSR